MIKIEVFTLPGCARCSTGIDALEDIANSFGPNAFLWEERNLLQHIDDAVQLGILTSPAMAINGKLAFTAALPTPEQLRAELVKFVNT